MGHIIFYVHDLRSSGVVRDTIKLADHCAAAHDVTLVAGHGDGFFRDDAGGGPYRLEILLPTARARLNKIRAALAFRRWLSRRPSGVVVSMGNLGHATPFLACRGNGGMRRIYRISNEIDRGDGLRGALRSFWMSRLIADADRVPLVGRALARNPLFGKALAEGRALEMTSGVDIEEARALARAPSPHPWLDQDVPVVLAIGRLRPQKNFGLLIEAVGRLRVTLPVRLIIIGGGTAEERAGLERQARDAGIGADFLLAGETANVFAWLARAQVFVLPSRWEGSSLALLEAMAVGTPVVASVLAGDAADILCDGRHGLLFDGVDPGALARAILAQLDDRRVSPGDRASDYAMPLGAYLRMIEQVLAERRQAASGRKPHSEATVAGTGIGRSVR